MYESMSIKAFLNILKEYYTGVGSIKARIGKRVIENEGRQSVKLKKFQFFNMAGGNGIGNNHIVTAFTNFGIFLN